MEILAGIILLGIIAFILFIYFPCILSEGFSQEEREREDAEKYK